MLKSFPPESEPKTGAHFAPFILLGILYMMVLLNYWQIHTYAAFNELPLNLREAANIINTRALVDPEAPRMYSWESLPEQTNLYGPIYPLAAAPLAWLLPESPYLAHRLTNALFLAASCGLIGWVIAKTSGWLFGAVGSILFYSSMVASPSIAAGPDCLAALFYILSLALIQHFGFRWPTIILSMSLGFFGLLTKPYAVLAIPGMLAYIYLFVSPKRALGAFGFALIIALAGFLILKVITPAYFYEVFSIHSSFATRLFEQLIRQTLEFSYLHLGIFLLFALTFPYRALIQFNRFQASCFFGSRPLMAEPISFDRFMALIAGAIMLLFMGWHGGAYLIYYNHLLLPPLLISALSRQSDTLVRPGVVVVMLTLAAATQLYFSPAKPAEETRPKVLDYLSYETEPILFDPILEPFLKEFPNATLVDNGQAEYLLKHDLLFESPLDDKLRDLHLKERSKIVEQHYKYLLLSVLYDRPHLFANVEISPLLEKYYGPKWVFNLPVYHVAFRDRDQFGKDECTIFVFERRILDAEH